MSAAVTLAVRLRASRARANTDTIHGCGLVGCLRLRDASSGPTACEAEADVAQLAGPPVQRSHQSQQRAPSAVRGVIKHLLRWSGRA